MTPRTVEALVAVHDPRRPLTRCLRSILDQRDALSDAGARLCVRVVVHNTDLDGVRATVPEELAGQVRWSHLRDGILSAAGPFNRGLEEAEGDYVSTVGSDDVLEPGALAAWYRRAEQTRADAVVAALRTPAGVVATPYLRPGRRDVLHPVHDGLAYRTAPLGLLRLETLRDVGFRYTEGGHSNGEDVEPALRLWFSGARVTYPYGAPCYRVLDDMGAGRVTAVVGPLAREVGFLAPLLAQPWLAGLPRAARESIAVKLARHQLVTGIERRARLAAPNASSPDAPALWTADDAACVRSSRAGLEALSGNGLAALSPAELDLLTGAAEAHDATALLAAQARAAALPASLRVLPARPTGLLGWSSRPVQLVRGQAAQRSGVFTHPTPSPQWVAGLALG